jgi:molybdopterin converting factor subunit 1
MTVRVLLFARARELAGAGEVAVELPAGATVADLRAALAAAHPTLGDVLARSAVAVDEEFAEDGTMIGEGEVAAVIPPVSGGEL